jgi:hypothetical protein
MHFLACHREVVQRIRQDRVVEVRIEQGQDHADACEAERRQNAQRNRLAEVGRPEEREQNPGGTSRSCSNCPP